MNLEDWANAQVGKFLPANSADGGTFDDGDLTAQCVTLDKHYFADNTTIPNPAQGRGNAKDLGDNLMAQGFVDWIQDGNQRQPGDIIVWKQDGGGYGHTGILLSGDRVVESNAGLAGTPSRVITSGKDSWTVYAVRIDPLNASWRKGGPTFYRIKEQFMGEDMAKWSLDAVRIVNREILGRDGDGGRNDAFTDPNTNPGIEASGVLDTEMKPDDILTYFNSDEANAYRSNKQLWYEGFNEGDRVNVNLDLYGSDKGLFKSFVGTDTAPVRWKDAIYGILTSDEYKNNIPTVTVEVPAPTPVPVTPAEPTPVMPVTPTLVQPQTAWDKFVTWFNKTFK